MVVLSRVADDTSSGVQDSLELVGEGLGCTGEKQCCSSPHVMLRRRGLASQRTRRQVYVGPVEAGAASIEARFSLRMPS